MCMSTEMLAGIASRVAELQDAVTEDPNFMVPKANVDK